MKRMLAILLAMLMCLSLLAGCGGSGTDTSDADKGTSETPKAEVTPSVKLDEPPGEDQILSDINAFSYSVLPEGTVASSCEIIKRQSNPEDKEDITYCRVVAPSNEFTVSEYYVKLLYNFYDVGGWILDEMEPDQVDKWGPIDFMGADGRPLGDSMLELGAPDAYYNVADDGVWSEDGTWYDKDGKLRYKDMWGQYCAGILYRHESDGLVYLFDADENKLSDGYEDISLAGSIRDEDGKVIDHRWRVYRGNQFGFLNDAGTEVIPVVYNVEYMRLNRDKELEVSEQSPSFEYGLVLINDGEYRIIMDANGNTLKRYHYDEYRTFQAYKNGFSLEAAHGNYEEMVYDRTGAPILNGDFYDLCVSDDHISAYNGDRWMIFDWDGVNTGWQPGGIWCLWRYDRGNNDVYYINDSDMGSFLSDNVGDPIAFVSGWRSGYDSIITNDCGVLDYNGDWLIYPEYDNIYVYEGGLYEVIREDGSAALFDWQGRQRTIFYDEILTSSESGRYFVVSLDGKAWLLPSPISEEELKECPELSNDFYW